MSDDSFDVYSDLFQRKDCFSRYWTFLTYHKLTLSYIFIAINYVKSPIFDRRFFFICKRKNTRSVYYQMQLKKSFIPILWSITLNKKTLILNSYEVIFLTFERAYLSTSWIRNFKTFVAQCEYHCKRVHYNFNPCCHGSFIVISILDNYIIANF